MNQGGDRPEFSRVKKILEDANGRPIVVANENPILKTRECMKSNIEIDMQQQWQPTLLLRTYPHKFIKKEIGFY